MSKLKNWITAWLKKGAVTEEHAQYLKKQRLRDLSILILQIFILIAFFFLWELAARYKLINSFITSQPTRIWVTLAKMVIKGDLWTHIWVTVSETVIGFLSGTLIGAIVAIALWWSDYLSQLLEPYIVVLNAIPKVALGPIFIIWLSNDTPAIIAMALAISVIVTIMTLHNGFMEVEENKIKLLLTFGATKFQILKKVILPASLPTFFSALKINVGLSLVGTIVGEFLVSKAGLGYLIIYGGQVFNLSLVMSSVLILCIVAFLMYYIIALLEKWVVKWNTNSKTE
ncbi:sulfonate ABC transporter permease [Anoxybacter fermentans]|uniref:Sulfonate ABC transporter permease n=1 Tax=Anoxybacter fermentans TaxID=1323375 RepID=A0A3Q9HPW8_9FIRM|nr:ABC transporter permease [Anoxybacter fermentans]AZR72800.1 sulfonate ABC transporter permease [Anoxybacter fermentans]